MAMQGRLLEEFKAFQAEFHKNADHAALAAAFNARPTTGVGIQVGKVEEALFEAIFLEMKSPKNRDRMNDRHLALQRFENGCHFSGTRESVEKMAQSFWGGARSWLEDKAPSIPESDVITKPERAVADMPIPTDEVRPERDWRAAFKRVTHPSQWRQRENGDGNPPTGGAVGRG